MNPKIRLVVKSIPILLLALGVSLRYASADIRVVGGVETANSNCGVDYSTFGGLVVAQTDNTSVTFEPDDQPGHQFFTATCTAIQASATGTADNLLGILRSYSAETDGTAGMDAEFHDQITFFNQSTESLAITVRWNVEGTLSAAPSAQNSTDGYASYTCNFSFGAAGTGGTFVSNGSVNINGDPASNYENNFVAEGTWDDPGESAEVVPNGNGLSGASFVANYQVTPGQSLVFVDAVLSTGAQRAESVADFQDTAGFELEVPAGVSFTSAAGLLSEGSRLLNISTRADVLTGDSVAIAGFIVTGEDAKEVIVRGIGPSLADQGVSGALSDTTLELHHTDEMGNDEILASNDDWQDTQEAEIEATGIPPNNPLESAIVETLDPGFYTAILRGKNAATGVGLIEVYDLESTVNSRLANISTRAFVETGDNVLIGGIIGGGNGSQPQVLIRAIGPSLSGLGVADALQDPVLELHDADGALVTTNDDWQSDQQAEIEATGIPPNDPKESAILATLLPTNYTAIVRGANDTTGVALVEVYHLQ